MIDTNCGVNYQLTDFLFLFLFFSLGSLQEWKIMVFNKGEYTHIYKRAQQVELSLYEPNCIGLNYYMSLTRLIISCNFVSKLK
jgi:hypothetical protein